MGKPPKKTVDLSSDSDRFAKRPRMSNSTLDSIGAPPVSSPDADKSGLASNIEPLSIVADSLTPVVGSTSVTETAIVAGDDLGPSPKSPVATTDLKEDTPDVDSSSNPVPAVVINSSTAVVSDLEGVDRTKSWDNDNGTLDGLPAWNHPDLPEEDIIKTFREECLQDTYGSMPLMKYSVDFLSYPRDGEYVQMEGIAFEKVKESLTEGQIRFAKRAISFVNHGNHVVNPCRANPFINSLRYKRVDGETSTKANKFLHYQNEPVLCVTFVIVQDSNLMEARTFSSNSTRYLVKDACIIPIRHEHERFTAFNRHVLHAEPLYITGFAGEIPTMNVGTRFVTADRQRGNKSSQSTWATMRPESYRAPAKHLTAPKVSRKKIVLFPSDDVPVYDFSGLDFNFDSHFDLPDLSTVFRKISDEPMNNVPAIIAYYPSVYVKDGMNIISLNLRWMGVLDC